MWTGGSLQEGESSRGEDIRYRRKDCCLLDGWENDRDSHCCLCVHPCGWCEFRALSAAWELQRARSCRDWRSPAGNRSRRLPWHR